MQISANNDVKGIDVSHHQGVIDWKKVAGDGVKYAIIKASEGVSRIDPKLSVNATGAKANKILTSFYHYARPENNAADKEASHFATAVLGLHVDFPLVLDVEGEASKIGKSKLTQWCEVFCTTLKRLTGKDVMIYTGASFAKDYLGAPLGKYPLWVANYGRGLTKAPMQNPTWSVWSLYQYTETGKVNGISGNVDVNVMNKAFYDNYTKPVTPAKPVTPTPAAPTTKQDTNTEINVFVNGVKMQDAGVLSVQGRSYPNADALKALGIEVRFDNATKTLYLKNK